MNLMTILMHGSAIMNAVQTIEEIVGRVVKSETKLPAPSDVQQFLDAVQKLVDAGVIDIPGVDDHAILDGIRKMADQISAALDQGHKVIQTFGEIRNASILHPDHPAQIAAKASDAQPVVDSELAKDLDQGVKS